jgi:DNA modification methylase
MMNGYKYGGGNMIIQADALHLPVKSEMVDSIVTDPPYGLKFMGKNWDHGVPGVPFWEEALRVAKPGAYLLAFGGTRTFHRLAVAIEDAGWEIRDCVMWVYGSGFPKSHDVSKAIDKTVGAVREVVGKSQWSNRTPNGCVGIRGNEFPKDKTLTAPATDAARQWEGWGTALKPAWEPIIVARKPIQGTVAENVLKYGTGGINIDGCRVGEDTIKTQGGDKFPGVYGTYATCPESVHLGRWPANLIHDGSDEVAGLFPVTSSGKMPAGQKRLNSEGPNRNTFGYMAPDTTKRDTPADSGSAARFFYCAKSSKSDRGEGNNHCTVKPLALMRYLCRLVTPPGGMILDPFMGSGSTGKAAEVEGFRFIGIELEKEYTEIAKGRIDAVQPLLMAL